MKKIPCLILIVFMALTLVGCENNRFSRQPVGGDDDYFTVIKSGRRYVVIQHNETGVCYLYWHYDYGGGLSVIVNADGTPYTGG